MNSPSDKAQKSTAWLSLALGFLGIVIGIIAIFAPRRLARGVGVRGHPLLFRLFGLRQIISGTGILASGRKAGWFWSRVGGGAIDLALLGAASRGHRVNKARLSTATGTVAVAALADTYGALTSESGNPVHAVKSITVYAPPERLRAALRDLENWPAFIRGLESVNRMNEREFRFVMKTLSGASVESIATLIEDLPDRLRVSSSGDPVNFTALIQLTPAAGHRGTVVSVDLEYLPRWWKIAKPSKLLAKALEERMDADLHRFEQWMETGSVVSTEGQPSGRSSTVFAEIVGR